MIFVTFKGNRKRKDKAKKFSKNINKPKEVKIIKRKDEVEKKTTISNINYGPLINISNFNANFNNQSW